MAGNLGTASVIGFMPYRYAKSRRDGSQADVSRYGTFRALSPFAIYPGRIPIPGRLSYVFRSYWEADDNLLDWAADSVEGVWQGLKCLDNGIDERLFHGQPKKRRGRPDGHLFADYRLLDYGQAKALIYIPTYLELLRQQSAVLAKLDQAVEIVDVSYQPDTLGAKPISHAALLVDYLNGDLEPYEAAHQRLLELAERMEQRYSENTDADVTPVGAEFVEIGERVRQLGFPPTTTYSDCARLFERENLMLMAVHSSGCGDEVEPVTELLNQWLQHGLLTKNEANDLAKAAPMSRMGGWWVERT